MKSKILFICCFILLLCGCSKKEDTKTEELLTNNDIGFTIIVEDGRGITKDSRINHINDYIGDQYIESKKNNDTASRTAAHIFRKAFQHALRSVRRRGAG